MENTNTISTILIQKLYDKLENNLMLLKKIEKKELIDSTFANHTLVKYIKLIKNIASIIY